MNMLENRKRMIDLGTDIADGKPVDLICPYCGTSNLIFSFTVIKYSLYGLFLLCRNCKNGHHFTFTTKPSGFRQELVLDKFQRLEDKAVRLASESNPETPPANE